MDKNCVIYKTADIIGKKWALLILLELYKGEGKKRYSEIRKKMPEITPRMLSARLKEFEQEGLLTKKVDTRQVPIKSEYTLTREGKELMQAVKALKKWALKNRFRSRACGERECEYCDL